jgi:plastocyanin
MANLLLDASSSSVFWMGLALVLIVAIVGYIMARRPFADPTSVAESAKVVHDWIPTGRIDFAGPSMDVNAADVPAAFYLQAEDIRILISISGIERKEIRWRKATLTEAKRVVNIFHRQMERRVDPIVENSTSTGSSAEQTDAKVIQVTIDQLVFSPMEIKAKAGDTIEWINKDLVAHTATVRDDWDVIIDANKSASLVLQKAGAVEYYCRFHPNMKGHIIVNPK